jgi:hypothetical protein
VVQPGPDPVGTPAPSTGPTSAQIKARALTDVVTKAKLAAIVKRRGVSQPVTALLAGRAEIHWWAKVKGRRSLIASGRTTFTAAGTRTVKVKLNSTGRALLRKAKRVTVTAELTFTPTSGAAVKAARKLVLRR